MNIGIMFRWATIPTEDPIGLVVSLDSNGNLVLGSSNIIGIVSANPEILLNNSSEWGGKYVVDPFLRREKEMIDGQVGDKVSNNYNPNLSYESHAERSNWSIVVTHGIVVARSVKAISGNKVGVNRAGNVVNRGKAFQVVEVIRQPSLEQGFMSTKVTEHGLVKLMVR